jgi:translation initiation factor 2 beta subunit (eIF-2beta)/eIF-5
MIEPGNSIDMVSSSNHKEEYYNDGDNDGDNDNCDNDNCDNNNCDNNNCDGKDDIDHDVSYDLDSLLDRLYENLGGDQYKKIRINIRPPEITSLPKRTIITNMAIIADHIKRDVNIIHTFFKSELQATITINEKGHFIIRGKFKQSNIEKILKSFIAIYCQCFTCKCLDTNLEDKNGFKRIVCNKCKAITTINYKSTVNYK